MIEPGQLLIWKERFMDERQLEKNYLQTLMLYELGASIGESLVFKGGTALSMFHGLNRFSEDLDFDYVDEKSRSSTVSGLERVFGRIGAIYDISKMKRRGTHTSLDIELHIKGPLFKMRKIEQVLQLDLSMREKVLMVPDVLTITPIYPDIPTFIIKVMAPKEILAEKIRALLTRSTLKARDLYDISYLLNNLHIEADMHLVDLKLRAQALHFSKVAIGERLDSMDKRTWVSEMSNLLKAVPDLDPLMRSVKNALLK